MAGRDDSRAEDLRRLLTDAVEVQLAALRAGISFWSEWIEQTTEFVQEATATLSRIASDDQEAKDVLLELVDAGRASVRGLTEIPRHTAARFIEELDRFEEAKATAKSKAVAPKAPKPAPTKGASRKAGKAKKKAARPKRAGKVKA
jgi:hypothetical protein